MKKATIPQSVRRELALQHGGLPGSTVAARCAYCAAVGEIHWPMLARSGRPGAWVMFPGLEIDHRVPEFLGGASTADNLTLACRTCNRQKGARA
jgi:5-methylcytosine-specific restriction endonuclease McrA